ncbi:DUF6843 domain-containing protein [Poritiphilus flavus]|uniref:DUF6843 domain-containing protein n=1 Tax=Poritiphilus flavus TaxID=2697053 RepID=A0A6L9ED51_9FLAO|nr:hypothetical protein [Poritiphilus flavus]NAS12670.1 hypothetical protein [Poritiphilus flavus]
MTNYLEVQMIKKIAFCLLFLLTLASCAQEAEDTIRLIPEGYQGAVLIIFNQEDGTPKEYEESKRVYRIPTDGVLRTKFKPNFGTQKHQFFYVDDEGKRTEIPFVMVQGKENLSGINKGDGKVYAYLERASGESIKIDADGNEYSISPTRTFYLGDLKDIDKDYREQLDFTFKHHKNQ